jgi:hypothetical protein
MIADTNFVFEYNEPQGINLARANELPIVPDEFNYYQSTAQSFYFIEDINTANIDIELGDWIVAYNDETIVGSRSWNGQYTDVPAMGYDSTDDNTLGYCQINDTPIFKLHKSDGEVIDLVSDNIPQWDNNQVNIIILTTIELPNEIHLHNSYPNPFNPSTTIHYEIPNDGMHIDLAIYDIRGRLVAQLVNQFQDATYDGYKVIWNANDVSSGMYIVSIPYNFISIICCILELIY